MINSSWVTSIFKLWLNRVSKTNLDFKKCLQIKSEGKSLLNIYNYFFPSNWFNIGNSIKITLLHLHFTSTIYTAHLEETLKVKFLYKMKKSMKISKHFGHTMCSNWYTSIIYVRFKYTHFYKIFYSYNHGNNTNYVSGKIFNGLINPFKRTCIRNKCTQQSFASVNM